MSESTVHANLVSLLVGWIADSFLDGDAGYILIESPDRPPQRKPPQVYGYTPDVYVRDPANCRIIMGEAKTARDIDCNHTMEQIKAFLRKSAEFKRSVFVFAVPWYRVGHAAAVLVYCKRQTGAEKVETKVLEQLPG